MTSTMYCNGAKFSRSELMESALAATWTNEEAEELASRVVEIMAKTMPEKLSWFPDTSEIILLDIKKPLSEYERETFDFDALLSSAFDLAISETF